LKAAKDSWQRRVSRLWPTKLTLNRVALLDHHETDETRRIAEDFFNSAQERLHSQCSTGQGGLHSDYPLQHLQMS
jgi:hypothetical protein